MLDSTIIKIDLCQWTLQITTTLTEDALLIFWQLGVEKMLAWPGIEPTTLNLSSQSGGAFDHLATVTKGYTEFLLKVFC